MNQSFTEVAYSDFLNQPTGLFNRLAAGEIFVIRGAQEPGKLLEMAFNAVEACGGKTVRHEIEAWSQQRVIPTAASCAHLANVLSDMRKAYIPALLFADAIRGMGFPQPIVIENGAPRFQLPRKVENELLTKKDILHSGVLEDPGNDPSYHVMLISEHAAHRDISRPCYHVQSNFWCALQEIKEDESLIIFPEMFRNPTPDRIFFKAPKDQSDDPNDWGYGPALRIPLNLGDIILFSGDHLHCNPIQRGDTLRLSWDFRVIGPCYDDTGWYRLGFFDLRNFTADNAEKLGRDSAIDKAVSVWSHWHSPPESPLDYLNENFSNATAWQFLAWLVHHPDPSPKYLAETIKALKAFPFSEDRFIWPYFLAQKKFPALNLHQSLLDYLVKYVSSYFWACVFGGLALGDGRKHLALNAFERAKDLARNTHVTLTHSNMDYLSVLTESKSPLKPFLYPMMPDDVDEVIRIYRSDLIKSGLNSKTVTLITGIPFPAHMFKPRYPFLEETDSKSSLVGRFVEIFTAPSAVQHRRFKIAPSWPPF